MISPAAGRLVLPDCQPIDASAFRLEFTRLMRGRVVHALALSFALATSDSISGYPTVADADVLLVVLWVLYVQLGRLITTATAVAVLSGLQAAIVRPEIRRLAMAIAIASMAVAVPAFVTMPSFRWGPVPIVSPWSLFLYMMWEALAVSVLLAVLYEWEWASDRVLEAVRFSRSGQEAAERGTLESRLKAMQARIDPELLFAVIDRAQTLYANQAEAAERLLERLIDYLRATLPGRGSTAVTLAQELELCATYLDLRKSLRDGPLVYDIPSTAAGDRHFPPSVMLALLQTLIPEIGSGAVTIAITVRDSQSSLSIDLCCAPAAAMPTAYSLVSAEDVLRRFFGDRASIHVRSDGGRGTTLSMEIRHAAG